MESAEGSRRLGYEHRPRTETEDDTSTIDEINALELPEDGDETLVDLRAELGGVPAWGLDGTAAVQDASR